MGERSNPSGHGRSGATGRSKGTLDITDIHSELGQSVLQETRLRILAVLASPEAAQRGGFSLQELGQVLSCSPQNAHHHLKILEKTGAAYVARTEATQRIPRQFWTTDVRRLRILPIDGTVLEVDLSLPEGAVRGLSRRVRQWAEENGTAAHEAVALKLALFLSSLDRPAADALLRVLKEHNDGRSR